MNNNTNLPLTYIAWADIVLERWKRKLYQLKIDRTFSLNESLTKEVFFDSGGNTTAIHFTFLYYGKFIDMGVGKGVPIGLVPEQAISRHLIGRDATNRRAPKKWYSKVFYTESAKLKFIISEKYALKATVGICEIINNANSGNSNP